MTRTSRGPSATAELLVFYVPPQFISKRNSKTVIEIGPHFPML